MKFNDQKQMSRREMLKVAGLAGLAGVASVTGLAAAEPAKAEGEPQLPQVPRRVLGKTGQKVPILLMGMAMKFDNKFEPKFAEAMRFGVNNFDAADCYAGGTSESALGNFVDRTGKRKEMWITTKSCDHSPAGVERLVNQSFERLKTDYVDLMFLHGLKDEKFLSPEMAQMADKLKKAGKIRFFGFSCHDGTGAQLLTKAATLPWIDAIMFKYNFRDYGNQELNNAMDACHKSNIGLIAMKTQGSAVSFDDRVKKFEGEKFNRAQAVLKAVWADERIAAAVSHMDTLEKMKQNIAAALDQTPIAAADQARLQQYAAATEDLYCAGCDHICGQELPAGLQVGNTLRFLMYHDSYRDPEKARELFAKLPAEARQLAGVDFSAASAVCPRHINIAKHMERASHVLA